MSPEPPTSPSSTKWTKDNFRVRNCTNSWSSTVLQQINRHEWVKPEWVRALHASIKTWHPRSLNYTIGRALVSTVGSFICESPPLKPWKSDWEMLSLFASAWLSLALLQLSGCQVMDDSLHVGGLRPWPMAFQIRDMQREIHHSNPCMVIEVLAIVGFHISYKLWEVQFHQVFFHIVLSDSGDPF